jgi:sialate O-acetylesterase
MKVPGSWIEQQIAGNGAIWVRKKFTLEADYSHEDLQIELGGIDKHDIVYINGTEVGRTGKGFEDQYWEVPRSYTIPGKLLHVGENTIAIRVFSFAFDGSFRPPEEAYFIHGSNVNIPLAGDWKVFVEYDRGRVFLPRLMSITSHTTPTLLFDSMIRPLLPFTIRGVLWYQGESNANKLDEAYLYKRQMETLVRDWRNHWENPDLPFIQVQLADYRKECDYDEFSPWAVLRDCQGKVCKSSSGVFMATALATGEIEDIHPQNKKEIGKRLAAAALHHVYGMSDILPSGPVYKSAQNDGGKLRISFDYADNMVLKDDAGKAFYLAGADKIYYPADHAVISGNELELSAKNVPEPYFVRYAWSDNPENILWNSQYPAEAFSSDEDA